MGLIFDVMPIDYKKYHPEWKTRIVPDILERAGNCCEFCNVPNGKWILRGTGGGTEAYQDEDGNIFDASNSVNIGDAYVGEVDPTGNTNPIRIVLTIMHLDHDVTNNDYSNLKAACQLHHLRYDKEHHAGTRRKNKEKIQPKLF